jgi:di/tricarboxylate transporter
MLSTNQKPIIKLKKKRTFDLSEIFNSFFRCKKSGADEVGSRTNLQYILKQQYKQLGPVSWQEYTITILFIAVIVLWVTRDFSSYPGWNVLFQKE